VSYFLLYTRALLCLVEKPNPVRYAIINSSLLYIGKGTKVLKDNRHKEREKERKGTC